MLSLLRREREFRKLWAGQTISLLGDQITGVALPLTAVLVLGASAAEMGVLVAAEWLPYLLLSVVAALWVDRRRRRRLVLVAADVARTPSTC
jgi:MFS family permease